MGKMKEAAKCLALTIIAFSIAYAMEGFPFEKAIIFYSQATTNGFIVSAHEDVDIGESGRTVETYTYNFTYEVNGKIHKNSKTHGGCLKEEFRNISEPVPAKIMYSTIFPNIAYPDDDGEISFGDYVVRGSLGTFLWYGAAAWLSWLFIKGTYFPEKKKYSSWRTNENAQN